MINADLEDATRILARTQSLSQKNIASEADLTRHQARVGVLTAQLRQAQSQLETARLDAQRSAALLDKHAVRAPFSGVVVDRSAQPGEMISPMSSGGFTRTGICTIVDMDSIEIEVDVNEAFIGRVKKGGNVNAVLDAYPDWTIPASVIAIVPTANREKATVKVRIGREAQGSAHPPRHGREGHVPRAGSARQGIRGRGLSARAIERARTTQEKTLAPTPDGSARRPEQEASSRARRPSRSSTSSTSPFRAAISSP